MLARSDKGKKIKVHFMGVGGSALSGVSIMAQKKGFLVSGCDLDPDTAYLDKLKEAGIKVMRGHDKGHLKDIDILAVSPAVVYQNKKHPEYTAAEKSGILKTWDQFVGKYLLSDKEVICVTGTHGKSTVTSMTSLLFEKASFDPCVIVGATVMEWGKNYRVGDSNIFIIEADDFYEKFLNYNPSTIILNNIEFDHPDFFRSEKHMISVYEKFVRLLKGSRNLIVNQDSPGNKKLFDSLDEAFLRSINIYGYSLSGKPLFEVVNSFRVKDIKKSKSID